MTRYNYPGYKPTLNGWLTVRPGTKYGYHGGADNPAEAGTPVYSEYDGEIFRSGPINGYGMSVIVKSKAPDGTEFYELYGHLGPGPLPAPGTKVNAGQPIPGAMIGTKEYVQSTVKGITSGPHLHREIISVQPNQEGRLGLYSSDIQHKADPDTFDIEHPVFPYEHEPKRAPISVPQVKNAGSASPPMGSLAQPSSSAGTAPGSLSNALMPPLLSPGTAIPGAEGPTSVGGPAGPKPLMPPSQPRLPLPDVPSPSATSPLNFAPQGLLKFWPLTVPDSSSRDSSSAIPRSPLQGGSVPASSGLRGPRASGLPASPGAPVTRKAVLRSQAPVRFPLEALLASDPGRALEEWASASPRSADAPPTQAAPGGLLALLAAAASTDSSGPLQATAPEDPAMVRRLVRWPAQ